MTATMDAARVLFDKLSLEYIQKELLGQAFENNWMECKQKEKPEKSEVSEGDWLYFAKAQSGFANTSGGVLIWGLKATKKDDTDIVHSIAEIQGLKAFESRMRELETRGVERLIEGIEYKAIEKKKDTGILAIFIPQSRRPPHRSLRDFKFYIRAGGTFSSLDLNIIEELFHRRSMPELDFCVRYENSSHVRVILKNAGEASAKAPFMVFSMPEGFSPTGFELDGNTRLTSCIRAASYRNSAGRFIEWKDGPKFVIHPEQEIQIIELRHVPGTFVSGAKSKFRYHLYSEGMERREGEFEFTAP